MIAGATALVTGGAGGLGAAICRVLAEAGAAVVVADRRGDAAADLARDLGGGARAAEIDLTDAAACHDLVARIARGGRLDILVNNAGIDHTLDVEAMSQAQFDAVIDVNLRAPFALARAAFPVMRAAGRGHIVNIASTAAKRAWPNASAYHASKWGLLGLSHALHAEGRAHGIKVTAVIAGGMATPFILDRFPDTPAANLQDPAGVARAIRFLIDQPGDSAIAELTIVPLGETRWP